jgi:hypothetical protein
MPSGKEKAPVGRGPRPGGVGMGVASKSEPCEPVTWGCLLVVSHMRCDDMGILTVPRRMILHAYSFCYHASWQ